MTPSERSALERFLKALEANRAAEDQATFVRTDLTFHYSLAMISHNPIFTSLHHALMDWLADQRSTSSRAGATRAEIFAQHRVIYEAVRDRDPVAAENAMEEHLTTVARYYWQAVAPVEANS